jgi:hypothetical protein
MADDPKLASDELKSLKTVFIGSNLIFWVLAVFFIVNVYKMKDTMDQMKNHLQMMMGQNLSGYELVDEEGKTVYRFQRMQMMPEDYMGMEGMEGMPGMPGMPGPEGSHAAPPPGGETPAATKEEGGGHEGHNHDHGEGSHD